MQQQRDEDVAVKGYMAGPRFRIWRLTHTRTELDRVKASTKRLSGDYEHEVDSCTSGSSQNRPSQAFRPQ